MTAPQAEASGEPRIGWGVIGIGGIAARRVVPELRDHARHSTAVAAVGDDAGHDRALASELGIPACYSSVHELLEDPAVEAVYIATPNDLHIEQALATARAGKPLLSEKPLGRTVCEAEEIVAACRDAGLLLGTGFMMRQHGLHFRAAEMVAEGAIGTPVLARAQLTCWYPPLPGAWRQDPLRSGGGCLVDMGCHCIDLLEFLLSSRVSEVTAQQSRLVHSYAVEDVSAALLRFENGAIGIVDNAYNIPDQSSANRLELYGSGGSIMAQGTIGQSSAGSMKISSSHQTEYASAQKRGGEDFAFREITAPPVPLYAAQMDAFARSLLYGEPLKSPGEDGLWSARVLDAIYRSVQTGRTQKVTGAA